MKTLLSPPTDNLHKFISVFGLILLFSSAILIYWGSNNAISRMEHYGSGIRNSEERLAKAKQNDDLDQVLIERNKIKTYSEIKNFHVYILNVQMIIASLLFFSGIHQIIFGFRSWRRKVQNLSDEYLKLEVDKMRLECKLLEIQCDVERKKHST